MNSEEEIERFHAWRKTTGSGDISAEERAFALGVQVEREACIARRYT